MDDSKQRLAISVIGLAGTFYFLSRMIGMYEKLTAPSSAVEEGTKLAARLAAHGKVNLEDLNEHERAICGDLVFAEDLEVNFADVAGLDEVKKGLGAVVAPFKDPERFAKSKLLSSPKGVLLYGPPGNGKSMMAAALAKECGANFINLRSSTLFQKVNQKSEKKKKRRKKS
jgi:SpoVK/Ycf46/Vps4 family AAA+-type ATPase